jgi:hypothetical protein
VAVGLALAVAYHILAARVQRWALRRNTLAGPAAMILGFVVRLALITVILVVVGLWSPLNIIAVCLAFVVLFSMLNGWSLYRLMSKRHGVPPSAGASGTT